MRKGLFAVYIPLLMSLFFLKVNAWEYLEPIESGDYIYSILENDTAVLRNYLGTESNIIIPSTIDGLPSSRHITPTFSSGLVLRTTFEPTLQLFLMVAPMKHGSAILCNTLSTANTLSHSIPEL